MYMLKDEYPKYADMVKQHYNLHQNKDVKNVGDYKFIADNSDENSAVFKNDKNKELVIAMRGTDIQEQKSRNILGRLGLETASQFLDVPNILGQGEFGELVKDTNDKIDSLKNSNPDFDIVLSGHSRSGKVAVDIGKDRDIKTFAFNPASLPHDVGKGRMERLQKYLFDKDLKYDPKNINVLITGNPSERQNLKSIAGTIGLGAMITGFDPVLAIGVPNLPTDDRRLDIVSLFSGYGAETTKLIPPKKIVMDGRVNQRFEDYTHHSIMNFLSDDEDDIQNYIRRLESNEKIPFKAMNYVSSTDIKKLCEIDPDNRLCPRKKINVKYL